MAETEAIAARFRRFAETEADASAPLYAAFARAVAADPAVLAFLSGLPAEKQQPNLLFAALRHVAGTPEDWPQARHGLMAQTEAVRQVMLQRRTQTNEPARCATLLPVLAGLPQPVALLEVGASAGLCLLPDRYGYRFGQHCLPPPSPDAPVFPCDTQPPTPLPDRLPEVIWRTGIDLAPVDVRDDAQCTWLETLVWPEHTDRLVRLRAALHVARADPPPVQRGDLLHDLPALARSAPAGATLVVFHTAVLAYVADPALRQRFVDTVRGLGAVWISNEAPDVFPAIGEQMRQRGPRGAFLLAVNGKPVAWTQPHGEWIAWLGPEDVTT